LKPKLYSKFTATIFRRFLIALFIYTIVLTVLFFISLTILSLRIWHGNEPFYPLLNWINHNRVVFSVFCWLSGFVVIFYSHWRKLLGFISQILDAGDQLVSQDDTLIKLPVELKQIEEKMNEAKLTAARNMRLAKEAEQRKNDLIVYLAHDLKTPLTSVIGYLTLLQDEQQISQELREKYCSVAIDKANRLEDLINEFFEITRFNLQEITLETGPISLSMMLRQMSDEMLPVVAEKRLDLQMDIPDGLMLDADSGKLARVFDNLFKNAVHYSDENTTIFISAAAFQNFITVKVRNTGETIPAQKLERIFEQFFRLDAARATKNGGAGLGLAIARQIVENHGGSITAASADGQTEFTITLPKKANVRKS